MTNKRKIRNNQQAYAQDTLNEDLESESNVLSEEVELRIFSNQHKRDHKISNGKQSVSNISAKVQAKPILPISKNILDSLNFGEDVDFENQAKNTILPLNIYEEKSNT